MPGGVRPTSSRVREALFSLVGHDLGGVRFLDAYGGSGLLALEAWSRGASVVAVERDPRVVKALRANVEALGAAVDVRTGDVLQLVGELGAFDVVVADPPYATAPGPVVAALAPVAAVLVIETDAAVPSPPAPAGVVVDRRREYGATALTVYRRR